MVNYTYECDEDFEKLFKGLDNSLKIKVKKQIFKITNNPYCGKPMRNIRKGTREVRVKPYRLSYLFDEEENHIIFLDFYHKDKQ